MDTNRPRRERPSFDALTLTALRLELSQTILGGAIQKVEVNGPTLVLEIYAHHARRRLVCHVGDDAARVHLTTSRLSPSALTETPLLLHLRKQIRGGRITGIVQPPYERILRLDISKRDGSVERRRGLIIEVMGRRSNAILVDDRDVILEAARRTPPSRSPRRPVLPSYPYAPPPPQDRVALDAPSAIEMLRIRADDRAPSETLRRFLSDEIAGLSPLAAREAAFRLAGSVEVSIGSVSDWRSVLESVHQLVRDAESCRGGWVASYEGVAMAVAPYELTELESRPDASVEHHDSISAAIEIAFSGDRAEPRLARPAPAILSRLTRQIEIEQRRENALSRELAEAERADILRQSGEAILASLGSIAPGATEVELGGLQVPLDPELTPVEMAKRYFADYRKARDAKAKLPELLTQARHRLEYLDSLSALIEAADSPAAYRQIERDLEIVSGDRPERRTGRPRSKQAEPRPRRFRAPDGTEVLVGTSASMNDRLTFKLAAPQDIWMHARGQPGAHVVVRARGRAPDESTLQLAADLAARFSRGRGSTSVPVDYTEARHVRKIRGAPPGLVRYVHERTLLGRPERAEGLITVSR